MKFGLYNPHGNRFGGSEAIFEFLPRGRDIGGRVGTPRGPKMAEIFFQNLDFF